MAEPVFHDVEWFASRIGMKPSWVRSHIGELPHHKVGRFVRFTEANVAEYVEWTRHVASSDGFDLTPRSRLHLERRRRVRGA